MRLRRLRRVKRVMRVALAALAALALAACTGTTGTVRVELTTSPDSHLLDAIERLRLTVTSPHQVVEATRTGGGFDLAVDLDATGGSGALILEGFDADGALVACGQSPRFPVAAINARVVIFMAAPRSFARAPVALPAPVSEVAGSALDYGAVLAGGRDAAGAPTTAIAVYNAYDHSLKPGKALLAARTGLAVATGTNGSVYLFGGVGPEGAPTGTLWRFDTTVADQGAYTSTSDNAAFARAGQLIVPVGTEHFLVTGQPALTLDAGALTARSDIAALPAVGAAATPSDGTATAIFADSQLVRFRQEAFDTLTAAGRPNATAATLPDGRVVVIGGGEPAARDALVIDGATGQVTAVADALATPRDHPSVAATSRYLVVAGGTDRAGAPIATAELLDVTTLANVQTLPILPRTGTFAVALPSDQVLLAGGAPASDALELFTPEPPP